MRTFWLVGLIVLVGGLQALGSSCTDFAGASPFSDFGSEDLPGVVLEDRVYQVTHVEGNYITVYFPEHRVFVQYDLEKGNMKNSLYVYFKAPDCVGDAVQEYAAYVGGITYVPEWWRGSETVHIKSTLSEIGCSPTRLSVRGSPARKTNIPAQLSFPLNVQ